MSKSLKIIIAVLAVLILGTVLVLYFLYRSHTSDAHLAAVPDNAAAVLKINIRDLALKADPKKLAALPAFRNQTGKNGKLIAPFIEDPFSTGIDPVENLYGFVARENDATVASLVFNVDDPEKLGAFINKLHLAEAATEINGVQVAPIDPMHCIAWNDESGMFLSSDKEGVNEIAAAYLNQDEKKSILNSAAFSSFSEKQFDIGLFLDNKKLAVMNGSFSAIGMADGTGELLLNFEDEKITAAYHNFPETAAIPVLKSSGFNSAHKGAIAPADPLLYLGLSVDTKMLLASAKTDPGIRENLMSFQAFTGLTEAEINTVFTGDLSLAITDYKDISVYDPRVMNTINTNLSRMHLSKEDEALERESAQLFAPMTYIAADITDEERIKGILRSAGFQEENGIFNVPGIDLIIYAVASNGHLLITNDYFAAEELQKNGKLNGQLPAVFDPKKPLAAWADLNQSHYPKSITEPSSAGYIESAVPFILTAAKPFQSATIEGSQDGSLLTIQLEKGEGNSLYRLIAYYATMN